MTREVEGLLRAAGGATVPVLIASAALVASAALAGCAVPFLDRSEEAAARIRAQDLGTLPYHPIAYHLDLSILAYQLYGQTLLWPFDPYYEEAGDDRDALMGRVREWVGGIAAEQAVAGGSVEDLRGPGLLGGFDDNPTHDPILYQYSRLHPWSDTLTYPSQEWTEYLTPSAITGRVAEVSVCVRTRGVSQGDYEAGAEGAVTVYPLPARRADAAPGARDLLLAFEGGTGDKGEPGQPASQSLMGFALVRATEGEAYDVHIAFRGSRSGSAGRALIQALSTRNPRGNPDSITDLGYRGEVHPVVSTAEGHRVSRGMATAIRASLPTLLRCLNQAVGQVRSVAPTSLYLTGHSLGGALAQMLASAVLLGDRYGPGGGGMPPSLRAWPWENLKLITYGAPRTGNTAWAETLTRDHLDAEFYEEQAAPFDGRAIGVTDAEVLPRLTDPLRPAAYRVLLPSDPITLEIGGDAHVGQTLYLEEGDALQILFGLDFDAHQPSRTRQLITDTLRDDRIPPIAWVDHPAEAFNPARDLDAVGTTEEYGRLIGAIRAYYEDRDTFFDRVAFDAWVPAFLDLVGGGE